MNKRYNVVYNAEILNGFLLDDVIKEISLLFKIPEDKAECFLKSNKNITIKKDLTKEQAEKYERKLTEIGLKVVIEEGVVKKKYQ